MSNIVDIGNFMYHVWSSAVEISRPLDYARGDLFSINYFTFIHSKQHRRGNKF